MEDILSIHLIEAPDEDDFYENRLETDLIRPIAQFCNISFTPHIVMNREYFCKAIDGINRDKGIPVLHFAGHGNKDGIGLPDKTLITWTDLRELLIPVNQRVGNILFVCMSCCEGFSAIKAAMSLWSDDPYVVIVGTSGKPTIAETSVAYATFYHQLNHLFRQIFTTGKSDIILPDITKNMCVASLHGEWELRTTEQIKDDFITVLRSILQLDS